MSKQLTGYEKVGRLFRLLGWLSLLSGVCFGFLIFTSEELRSDKMMIRLVVIFFVLPMLYLPLGKAIKEHRRWGRIVGNIVGVVSLTGIPIGTLIGIYVLTLLNKSWGEQPDQGELIKAQERTVANSSSSNTDTSSEQGLEAQIHVSTLQLTDQDIFNKGECPECGAKLEKEQERCSECDSLLIEYMDN